MPADMEFSSALDQLQQAWEQAESFANWDPPADGQYAWQFTRIKRSKSKDGVLQWHLFGIIEDPSNKDVDQKEWRPFYFTSKFMGFMKEFLITITGSVPIDVHEADALLDTLTGGIYSVEISTGMDKNGTPRRNCRVMRIVQLPPETTA